MNAPLDYPSEVAGAVLRGMFAAQNQTTDQLLTAYREEIRELRGTVGAIRGGITDLFEGRYAPTERAIFGCLYPSKASVAEHSPAVEW